MAETEKREPRPKLLHLQIIAFNKILEAHCTPGPDGMAIFEQGWNDDRVYAEAVANNPIPAQPISRNAIAQLRRTVMGLIQAPPLPKPAKVEAAPVVQGVSLKEVEELLGLFNDRWRKRFDRSVEDINRQFVVEREENDHRYTNWSEAVARRDSEAVKRVDRAEKQVETVIGELQKCNTRITGFVDRIEGRIAATDEEIHGWLLQIYDRLTALEAHLKPRGYTYTPPPGKKISTPPSGGNDEGSDRNVSDANGGAAPRSGA